MDDAVWRPCWHCANAVAPQAWMMRSGDHAVHSTMLALCQCRCASCVDDAVWRPNGSAPMPLRLCRGRCDLTIMLALRQCRRKSRNYHLELNQVCQFNIIFKHFCFVCQRAQFYSCAISVAISFTMGVMNYCITTANLFTKQILCQSKCMGC